MKILHLAASNRWTGAAAPALAETEALRAAGVDAHFAYVGGYKFEERLAGTEWAHPVILKREDPLSIARSVTAIRALVDSLGIDILHSHLTYDHWLARFAARGRRVAVVRTYHARRTIRRDPATKWLLRGTSAVCVVNSSFMTNRALLASEPTFTPPPVDHRFFVEGEREETRSKYGFDRESLVIGVIGKVAVRRGFEEAIDTFRIVRETNAAARLLVIGHGPHRPALETRIGALGLTDSVIWAGYQEARLPAHFSAMDALLFTRTGSDEGHRAVIEAMACSTPVFSYPIQGVPELYGNEREQFVADRSAAVSLVELLSKRLEKSVQQRALAHQLSLEFGFDRTAERLTALYTALYKELA